MLSPPRWEPCANLCDLPEGPEAHRRLLHTRRVLPSSLKGKLSGLLSWQWLPAHSLVVADTDGKEAALLGQWSKDRRAYLCCQAAFQNPTATAPAGQCSRIALLSVSGFLLPLGTGEGQDEARVAENS